MFHFSHIAEYYSWKASQFPGVGAGDVLTWYRACRDWYRIRSR